MYKLTQTPWLAQVMGGYLDLPEKTKECLTDDGWLLTGDIAKIDQDGSKMGPSGGQRQEGAR